jgi:hypothetical protein
MPTKLSPDDVTKIQGFKTAALARIAGLNGDHHSRAYISLAAADGVWLADLAESTDPTEAFQKQKVDELSKGLAGAVNRDDAEAHVRATDVILLCDLALTLAPPSAPAQAAPATGEGDGAQTE